MSLVWDDGEIYFKAKDVATALGYSDPKYAIWEHVWSKNKFEWGSFQRVGNSHPSNFHPQTLFLTEPGVYQLIFKSKLPSAEAFQDWVFSEVLPSIRKTGSYSMNSLCTTLSGMKHNVLSNNDRDQLTKFKTIVKTHANMLKNPVAVEKGQRGGLKAQENRQKQVEFKNTLAVKIFPHHALQYPVEPFHNGGLLVGPRGKVVYVITLQNS